MEVRVRTVRSQDAAALARLGVQLGYACTQDNVLARLGHVVEDHRNQVFVAEDDQGAVVGWIHIESVLSLLSEPFAEVEGLVVDEGSRGQNVGCALLKRAEEWAAEHGACDVRLRSRVDRPSAHKFYEKNGYWITKTQYAFVRSL